MDSEGGPDFLKHPGIDRRSGFPQRACWPQTEARICNDTIMKSYPIGINAVVKPDGTLRSGTKENLVVFELLREADRNFYAGDIERYRELHDKANRILASLKKRS